MIHLTCSLSTHSDRFKSNILFNSKQYLYKVAVWLEFELLVWHGVHTCRIQSTFIKNLLQTTSVQVQNITNYPFFFSFNPTVEAFDEHDTKLVDGENMS